ncbi:hypothetical protein AYK26_01570 [Euryarchaeota archaeon SM23-78]|nr:MAG: hypothetical protein AYK26_01570 [Euryarchaeota archaeon SM23-78]MBW3000444.1 hypothetical protein [Candidatus Woesearchaeota archaeon]
MVEWIKQGCEKGAVELLIGLDVYYLTPARVPPSDDDYYPVFLMPGENRAEAIAKMTKDPFCSHEATFKIPKGDESIDEAALSKLNIYASERVPTYLINKWLYDDD